MTTEQRVRSRLDAVVDPCSAANGTDLSVVDMGLVEDVEVDAGHVTVSLRLTSPMCTQIPYFVDEVDDAVGALPDVESVTLETDQGFEWHQDMMTDEARARRRDRQRALAERYDADAEVPPTATLADDAE